MTPITASSSIIPSILPPESLPKLAAMGNLKELRLAIRSGGDIDAVDENGYSALHHSILNNNFAMCADLLAARANPKTPDKNGNSSFHIAARLGHALILSQLLLFDPGSVDLRNNAGWTPLHLATRTGALDCVKELVFYKADINSAGYNQRTPLQIAAVSGHETIVAYFIDLKAVLDKKDLDGMTPLLFAAKGGYPSVVKLLLEAKADLSLVNNEGRNALHFAALNNRADLVEILADCDLDALDAHKETPLMIAAREGYSECFKQLLDRGANPKIQLPSKESLLHLATQRNHLRILQLLTTGLLPLDEKNPSGLTPLHMAITLNHFDAMVCLLEAHADINCPGPNGWTALHLAAKLGDPRFVSKLLALGAFINARTTDLGHTPLYVAVDRGHADCVSLLKLYNADPAIPSHAGFTPFDIAASKGQTAMLSLLRSLPRATSTPGLSSPTEPSSPMVLPSPRTPKLKLRVRDSFILTSEASGGGVSAPPLAKRARSNGTESGDFE